MKMNFYFVFQTAVRFETGGTEILLNVTGYVWFIWRSTALWQGTRWRSWLKHCATSWKVAGSIVDGVIRIFPSGCTIAPGLTHCLAEMTTRNISWGKDGRCVGLKPYHLYVPIVLKSGSLNLLEHSEPIQACNGIALPFTVLWRRMIW
jgi:hypothetical protein